MLESGKVVLRSKWGAVDPDAAITRSQESDRCVLEIYDISPIEIGGGVVKVVDVLIIACCLRSLFPPLWVLFLELWVEE